MSDSLNKLTDIIATLLEVDSAAIRPGVRRESIPQWDSLNHLNICVAVGQEFNTDFSALEIERIGGLDDIIRLLRQRNVSI